MVDGLSSDGLAITVTILGVGVGVGLGVIWQLRNQTSRFVETRNEMGKMNRFSERSTLSQIDEKIARLYQYTSDVKNWKTNGIDITFRTNEIVADLTAIVRVKDHRTDDQKIKLNEVVRHLTTAMKNENYDVGRIEDVAKLLS